MKKLSSKFCGSCGCVNRLKCFFRKSKAFTFSEVMIALVVLSASVFILTGIQVRAVSQTQNRREEIVRVFILKKFMYQLYSKFGFDKLSFKIEIDEPETKIKLREEDISKKSSLAQFRDQLKFVIVDAEWKVGSKKKMSKMLTIIPKESQESAADEKK
jgi:hypothetical protein